MRLRLKSYRRATVVLFAAITFAASPPVQAQGRAYGIGGPSVVAGWFGGGAGFHVAGGGEFLINQIAGAGAEFGILGNSSSLLTVTSFNGVVHLPLAGDWPSPFFTGGYSRFSSGEGTFHAWNLGAGADFWRKDHVGLRIELRDHVRPDSRGRVHYFSIRGGIVLK